MSEFKIKIDKHQDIVEDSNNDSNQLNEMLSQEIALIKQFFMFI
jgi:hypothetical protein